MNNTRALDDFFSELRRTGAGELRTDQYSRILYSTDASIYQVMPHGVFLPKSVDDIQAAVELAAKFGIPILPRAGGSSLAGQTVNEALVIDASRYLDEMIAVNREESWAEVQPGLVLDALNLHLKSHGLQFGPDPASSNRAAMGGIISNNATGSHSILYGMSADHVLEMTTTLSDGSVARFAPLDGEMLAQKKKLSGLEGELYRKVSELTTVNADVIRANTPAHWRRCGGYNLDRFIEGPSFRYRPDSRFNLARLLSGAEGTLGFITSLKLNLVPCPDKTALAILQFDDLFQALSSVPVILEADPSAVELLDNLAITMCRDVPQYARLLKTFVEGEPHCVLITEFYGENESELRGKIAGLGQHLKSNRIPCQIRPALAPELQTNVWTVRKVGLGLLMSIKGDFKPIPFIEDAAVPVDHLAEYVKKIEQFCRGIGTGIAYYAHASAGCIHIRPLINTKVAKEIAKLPEIAAFSMELVKGYGGAISSEHGDGRTRSWLNERFFGKELFELFRAVKSVFDPKNIFNPGNIVDGPAMTSHHRYGEGYTAIPLETHIDFSSDQGFDRAIEMCNGAGICRKTTTGVMCPSFMVTREEEHSTRGRANALRAAISGRLPASELTSQRMYEVMDLCVGCKACKAECPSSVDMAKIKFEFLARFRDANGAGLRSRLFGQISSLSKVSSGSLASLVNWSLRNPVVKWKLEKFLGISRERALPAFAKESFTRWFENRVILPPENAREVVLFNDTFNTYNDPHISIAAVEVLEATGFRVTLPGIKCCGRPMISKGLAKEAREAARDTVDKLFPFAERGIPIIGLEPSCILSLRDEYGYLLPDDERVTVVAEQSLTFEEFFVTEVNAQDLSFRIEKPHILLHGHCHQKALVGTGPAKKCLSLPGYRVSEIDSSCCGMAGSFGYEREHYEISKAMAELRLVPAIREAGPDTMIVASGTSCRHQIAHFTDRRVLHPAEVLRDALLKK
jgi:FAD/FMN-containing dehydrogenase/Fe-S oxidoreductase